MFPSCLNRVYTRCALQRNDFSLSAHCTYERTNKCKPQNISTPTVVFLQKGVCADSSVVIRTAKEQRGKGLSIAKVYQACLLTRSLAPFDSLRCIQHCWVVYMYSIIRFPDLPSFESHFQSKWVIGELGAVRL